jgi:hypothetical protein
MSMLFPEDHIAKSELSKVEQSADVKKMEIFFGLSH